MQTIVSSKPMQYEDVPGKSKLCRSCTSVLGARVWGLHKVCLTCYLSDKKKLFYSRVRLCVGKDACHEFIGRNKHGYGEFDLITEYGHEVFAHRVAWLLHYGSVPKATTGAIGTLVLHTCDNRRCVRISHLYLGTQKQNVADMNSRLRAPYRKGEHNGRSKLTAELVHQIRNSYIPGKHSDFNTVGLAKKYGVSNVLVGLVLNNKIWSHV